MGLFDKKRAQTPKRRELTSEEIEKNALFASVHNLFYPWTNASSFFFDLAFPNSARPPSVGDLADHRNWKPPHYLDLNPSEIRTMIYKLESREISIHELTRRIYGYETYNDFVALVDEAQMNGRAAASKNSLGLLRSAKPTKDWLHEIKFGYVESFIEKCLEDLGDRESTHSAVGELFRVRKDEIAPYTEAALTGFRTVNHILKKKSTFNVIRTPEAGKQLVNDVCYIGSNSVLPLEAICQTAWSAVDEIIDDLDEQMRRMLGDTPTNQKIYRGSNPLPYRTSLEATAHHGAMMAAIVYDPRSCNFYRGYPRAKFDPSESPWFSK